jgi:2,4-dienoyl-CoA reductase-like NADH-dependent reductase (Old Yellow Enzyme family)/thioredoxin reductase
MKYPNLFSEGKIGKVTLKNRVVMTALGNDLCSACGEITDHQIAFYEERARGGVGLIITELSLVKHPVGTPGFNCPRVDGRQFIPMWYRLANTIHKYDTKIFVQLAHSGRQSTSLMSQGAQIVAPSPIVSSATGETPRELAVSEIEDIETCFVTAAVNCKMAGVDGVELHGGHGYLINQFLSPQANKRMDEYGGTFENRVRFVRKIIEGIKGACGADFPIIMKLSIDEFLDGGITADEGVTIAKYLEGVGVDAINVTCGTWESFYTVIEPTSYDQGWRVYLAEAVKKEVDIPVIAVGVIREPEFAENVLAQNRADFIAIARGLLADPEWCNKARTGKMIRKCISCLFCVDGAFRAVHIGCAVNARTGRELEFSHVNKNGAQRKVVVVGGGPAGMEAARILAMRDFKVVLFEKEGQLGGQLNFGNKPRGKEKLNWLVEYLSNELRDLKVDVRLNAEATIEAIQAEEPHAIFLCTGGVPIIPNIPGADQGHVCVAEQALVEYTSFKGNKIAVIGAGMTGCETAELLASHGNEVFLIEMLPDVAPDAGWVNKMDMMRLLSEADVHIYTNYKLKEITATGVVLENLKEGNQLTMPADKVVLSLGVKSHNPLYHKLRDAFDNISVLGDARTPRRIVDAIREGFEKGTLLE